LILLCPISAESEKDPAKIRDFFLRKRLNLGKTVKPWFIQDPVRIYDKHIKGIVQDKIKIF